MTQDPRECIYFFVAAVGSQTQNDGSQDSSNWFPLLASPNAVEYWFPGGPNLYLPVYNVKLFSP